MRNKRILIICEDKKSSKTYLEAFKNDRRYKDNFHGISLQFFHPKKFTPKHLCDVALKKQEEAKFERNEYNRIYLVFDKDKHPNFKETINEINKIKDLYPIISIICFEYWVLLHYEFTTKPFETCNQLVNYLKAKYYPNYAKEENCFYTLLPKLDTAISNGKKVVRSVKADLNNGMHIADLGYYTNMHELVEELTKPFPFDF